MGLKFAPNLQVACVPGVSGRTLRQDEATLEDLKITASSRIILLGRKVGDRE